MHQMICVSKIMRYKEKILALFVYKYKLVDVHTSVSAYIITFLVLRMLKMCLLNWGKFKIVENEFLIVH